MKDFKIGDRVRVKDTPNPEWMQNMPALPDTIFKVEGRQNDKLILSMECSDARFIVDAELFELVETPEHPNNMAEFSYDAISEVEAKMVRNFGKKWREKACQVLVNSQDDGNYIQVSRNGIEMLAEEEPDPKTAFLTELQALMKRYNATIDVDGDECALWLIIDIGGHAIEYVAYDFYIGKEKQTALTPDNIFDYEKD